jgi:hypothetical protein
LAHAASEPIKPHVNGLWFLRPNSFVAPYLGVSKKGRVLSLGHSGTHNWNTGTVAKHWAVDEIRIESTQVVETSGSTTGLRTVEVRIVGVDAQNHVGRLEDKAAIGVGLGTTQEAEGGFPGGLSWRRLVGGEEADGREESRVDSTGIV